MLLDAQRFASSTGYPLSSSSNVKFLVVTQMSAALDRFDLFKVGNDGRLWWRATSTTFDDAVTRATTLARDDQCDYLILDFQIRAITRIKPSSRPPSPGHT